MSATRSPFSNQELKQLRSHFPYTHQDRIYLNHAAVAPLSSKVTNAIQKRMQRRSSGGVDTFERDAATAEMTRKYLANMINAPSEDRIAYVGNTSEGLNIVAGGLQWEEGDHILIADQEFPANVYPYLRLKNRGVRVEKIETDHGHITADLIEKHLKEDTRMVAVSAVQFLSGFQADLEKIGELCNKKECWFVVDGIQALGAFSIDVQKYRIDALVSGSHKWLMGPQGIGFIYLTEQLQEAIVDHSVGWLSVREPWLFFDTDQELDESARRYELGTPNANGIYGLHATLDHYHQVGGEKIARQIHYLTGHLLEEVKDWEYCNLITPELREKRAGIVALHLSEDIDQQALMDRLKQENLTIALRENCLRFSPHYYNNLSEIEQSLEIVRKTLRNQV